MATDLIDLDCYKEAKSIKSTDRDGKLQTLITQVSALIENYCNRLFTTYSTTPKVEWHDGKTNNVILKEFPIISVSSVTTSSDGGITTEAVVAADANNVGYFVDTQNCTLLKSDGTNFIDSYNIPFKSLEVTYLAGYTQDELPLDLQLATIDLVHYYENEENVPSKSLMGGNVDNAQPYSANSFPPAIRRVLDLYRYSP
jgi:hypothetical protein